MLKIRSNVLVSKHRIVLFDLETLPDVNEVIKVWPSLSDYPGKTLKATITSIICAGYKVFGSGRKTKVLNAWDYAEWKKDVNDDRKLVKAIRDVLVGADAVVTHNGKKFDWKYLQTRIIKHGLDPLPRIAHIDTCELAKRHMYSFNNRLGYLGEQFVSDRKLDNGGWNLWVDVFNRCPKAQKKMSLYCKQDVDLLEKLFLKLRPFALNLPNQAITSGNDHTCPTCGSYNVIKQGTRLTKTKEYHRYQCNECGSWSRSDAKDRNLRSI